MDSTEAELIARIVDDPDDEAGYLVYADWLIDRGDPRGELIALQRAAAHEPGKARAAERHLKANRARLLGTLAEHESQVRLEWHLGFVRSARVVADDERSAIALVDEVVRSPACRFLVRLVVKIIGKQRSYLEVERRLVEHGEPATLRELELGRPGEHGLSDELLAAFPRLARRTADWGKVVEAVRALRGRGPELELDRLALLGGEALPLDAAELVRGLDAEVRRKQPIGLVAMLQRTCEAEALDRYAASLVEAWHHHGAGRTRAWPYDVAALLGGARAAYALGEHLETSPHQRATHALDCLMRMRTPLALLEIFAASRLWQSRGEYAEELLERRAREAATTVPQLLALTGRALGDADPRELERFRALDARVLELLMVIGWTTTLAAVQELFVAHRRGEFLAWGKPKPVEVPTLGRRLRFWDRAPRGSVVPFLATPAGAVDLDGRPVDVALDEPIALAHPLELAPDERERWWAWQRDHAPPFDQLDRESAAAGRLKLDERFPSFGGLRGRGFRNGGRPNELHREMLLVKRYPYRGQVYTVRVDFATRAVTSAPRELPVVVQHELARDLIAALDDG